MAACVALAGIESREAGGQCWELQGHLRGQAPDERCRLPQSLGGRGPAPLLQPCHQSAVRPAAIQQASARCETHNSTPFSTQIDVRLSFKTGPRMSEFPGFAPQRFRRNTIGFVVQYDEQAYNTIVLQ